jgi:hypothetical protein
MDGEVSNTILHLPIMRLCIQTWPMLKVMPRVRQERSTLSQMWRQWLVSRQASVCKALTAADVGMWPAWCVPPAAGFASAFRRQ